MLINETLFNSMYEYFLMLKYKCVPPVHKKWWNTNTEYSELDKQNISFCYDVLTQVSRSFSYVIKILPNELSLELLVFYLRCRALDTVEDDPNAFDGNIKKKKKYLKKFYTHYNSLENVGEEKYRNLLENYDKVGSVNNLLCENSQLIIDDTVKEMGRGMSKYLHYRIKDMKQYNEYCYYVAGLVGRGFNKLFFNKGYCKDDFIDRVTNPNIVVANHNQGGLEMSMALLLQKTNITRDFREDLDENIQWYPQEIWKKYKNNIEDFDGDISSKNCLNELVADALECVEDTFEYHKLICHPDVFKFCAIPQVMAIATLNELYDNPEVFKKTIKINKGSTLNIMYNSNNMNDLYYWFSKYVSSIKAKIRNDDPNKDKILLICNNILSNIEKNYSPKMLTKKQMFGIVAIICAIIYLKYYK